MEGGTGRGGGGDKLNFCEDNVANVILVMDPNVPLDYAPGLELHHPIMSTLGGHVCRLERERDIDIERAK